jgi:hypothetical protein
MNPWDAAWYILEVACERLGHAICATSLGQRIFAFVANRADD